jgi:hypothetical protein
VPYYIVVRDLDTGLWEPTEHASWKDRARALEFCEDLRKLMGRRYRVIWIEDTEYEEEESDGCRGAGLILQLIRQCPSRRGSRLRAQPKRRGRLLPLIRQGGGAAEARSDAARFRLLT